MEDCLIHLFASLSTAQHNAGPQWLSSISNTLEVVGTPIVIRISKRFLLADH